MTSLLRISVLHSKRHLSQHSGLVAHSCPFSLCLDDTLSRRGSWVARALWSSLWPAQILYYSLAVIKIIRHASRMAWHGFLNSSFHADIPIWSWTLGQRKNSLIKKNVPGDAYQLIGASVFKRTQLFWQDLQAQGVWAGISTPSIRTHSSRSLATRTNHTRFHNAIS